MYLVLTSYPKVFLGNCLIANALDVLPLVFLSEILQVTISRSSGGWREIKAAGRRFGGGHKETWIVRYDVGTISVWFSWYYSPLSLQREREYVLQCKCNKK